MTDNLIQQVSQATAAKTDSQTAELKQLPPAQRIQLELGKAALQPVKDPAQVVINTPKGQVTLPLSSSSQGATAALPASQAGASAGTMQITKAEWTAQQLSLQLRPATIPGSQAVAPGQAVSPDSAAGSANLPAIKLTAEQLQQILSRLPSPQSPTGRPLAASFWIERGTIPVVLQASVSNNQLLLNMTQKGAPLSLPVSPELAKILSSAFSSATNSSSVQPSVSVPSGATALASIQIALSQRNVGTYLLMTQASPVSSGVNAVGANALGQTTMTFAVSHQVMGSLSRIADSTQLSFAANVTPQRVSWQGPDLATPPGYAGKQAQLLLQTGAAKDQPRATLLGADGKTHPIKLTAPQIEQVTKLVKAWMSGSEPLTAKTDKAQMLPPMPQGIKQALSEPRSSQVLRLQQLLQPLLQQNQIGDQAGRTALMKQGLTELMMEVVQAKEQAVGRPLHHSLQRVLDKLPNQLGALSALQKPPAESLVSLLEPVLKQVADGVPKASQLLDSDLARVLVMPEQVRLQDLLARPASGPAMDRLTQAIGLLFGIRWQLRGQSSAQQGGDASKQAGSALEQLFAAFSRPAKGKPSPQLKRVLERLRNDPDANAQLKEISRALGKSATQQQALTWQAAEQRTSGMNQPFAFPIQLEEQLHLVEGRIYQDEQADNNPGEQARQPAWKLQLRFDFPNTGPMLVNAKWHQQGTDIDVFSEKASTQVKAQQKMELWRQRLDALGLNPGQLSCKLGKVPEQLHQSVSQIIQTKV